MDPSTFGFDESDRPDHFPFQWNWPELPTFIESESARAYALLHFTYPGMLLTLPAVHLRQLMMWSQSMQKPRPSLCSWPASPQQMLHQECECGLMIPSELQPLHQHLEPTQQCEGVLGNWAAFSERKSISSFLCRSCWTGRRSRCTRVIFHPFDSLSLVPYSRSLSNVTC